jgi:NADH:ubiquinone oxidoreductase subunit H
MAPTKNTPRDSEDGNEIERPNYYLIAAVMVFALLALPETRLQDVFKMAVWTVIVLGVLTPFVWPLVKDTLSRIIFASIYILHILLMRTFYPRLPWDGYLGIGYAIVLEIMVFSIPIGWLEVRSRRTDQK